MHAEILNHDLNGASVADLKHVFADFKSIISCTGMNGPPGLQKKITDAVLEAQVPHFIPWQFGVDYDIIGCGSAQDLFTEQLDVRRSLRAQNKTKWSIVSTGVFMDFLFQPAFGVVDLEVNATDGEPIVRALGGWDFHLTATTVEDIGVCAAEMLFGSEPRRLARDSPNVISIAGDTLSYAQLADVVQTVIGREVRRELWTLDDLKTQLINDPGNGLIKYHCIWADGKGVAWNKAHSFNGRHGIEVETVQDLAAKKLRR